MAKKSGGKETFGNERLEIRLDVKAGAFDVVQKRNGTQWRMCRSDRKDLVLRRYGRDECVAALSDARRTEVVEISETARRVTYSDFKGVGSSAAVAVVLEINGEDLLVELEVTDSDPDWEFDSLYWPRGFVLDADRRNYWLFPMRGGRLLPSTVRKETDGRLGWTTTLKCYGAVQGGGGFLALMETPYDTLLAQTCSRKEGFKLFPRHLSSLGRFGYRRRVRYCFREKTDYVDLIRSVYRPHAARRGYLKTLRQKAAEDAKVKDLAGTLIFHQLIAYVDRRRMERTLVTFEHAAKAFEYIIRKSKAVKGLYHLDGWCRQGYDALHPDVCPPMAEAGGEKGLAALAERVRRLGFHFGLHDNYNLYFPDAEQYDEDDCVFGTNLKPFRDAFRAGGMNFIQSPPAARRFIIKNYLTGQNVYRRRWRPLKDVCRPTFCYIDQYLGSGGNVNEDFNPLHPLTREQYMNGMLENMLIMKRDVGCITSSEHMYEYGVPVYDVNGNSTGVALPDPSDEAIPAPLWNLAFHECMVVTHVDLDKRNYITCALMGGALHARANHGYLPREVWDLRAAALAESEPIRRLHEAVAFKECTGHRLLTPDGGRQETEFEDVTVGADYGKMEVEVTGSRRAEGKFSFA